MSYHNVNDIISNKLMIALELAIQVMVISPIQKAMKEVPVHFCVIATVHVATHNYKLDTCKLSRKVL